MTTLKAGCPIELLAVGVELPTLDAMKDSTNLPVLIKTGVSPFPIEP